MVLFQEMWVLMSWVEGLLWECVGSWDPWAGSGELICKDLLNSASDDITMVGSVYATETGKHRCEAPESQSVCMPLTWQLPLLHWKVPAISWDPRQAVSAPVERHPCGQRRCCWNLWYKVEPFLLFKDTLIGCYWPQMWVIMACLGRGICKRGHF